MCVVIIAMHISYYHYCTSDFIAIIDLLLFSNSPSSTNLLTCELQKEIFKQLLHMKCIIKFPMPLSY